jgi:hypothetical protein
MEAKPQTSRTVLSPVQAREIYQCKLKLLQPNASDPCLKSMVLKLKGQSVPVAACFGVSPKTVRDIWNRRTWAHATHDLWSHEINHSPSVKVRISFFRTVETLYQFRWPFFFPEWFKCLFVILMTVFSSTPRYTAFREKTRVDQRALAIASHVLDKIVSCHRQQQYQHNLLRKLRYRSISYRPRKTEATMTGAHG